ncbi:MAG: sulfatase-like hydrolase/transferase [Rhodospirillaceae bacterium]|nr:sulfatase-like hydrolase/transferase [Rhodospirillaceae bacterium]
MVWGSQRDPLPDTRGSFRMLKTIGPGESGYNRYDMRIADHAAAWLREAAKHDYPRPWVLYIGFVAPHFPLVAPQKYFDPYPIEDMPFPKLHPQGGYKRHPWVEEHAQFSQTDSQFESEDERLLAIAAYHALCTFVDERIGAVLDTLDETGLSDRTRVVYTSDHGDNVGARGLWGKSVLYEEASRIPMIVAGPDVPAGRTVATPVSLIDLYPTVIDAVGLDPAEDEAGLPGRSLFAILDGEDDPGRIAFSEYHAVGSNSGGFMLRKGRYKYHYYVGHPPELFDLEADPEELTDLAPDPAHAATLAECEALLREIVDPEDADRRARADQRALIERYGGWQEARKRGAPAATPAPGAGFE